MLIDGDYRTSLECGLNQPSVPVRLTGSRLSYSISILFGHRSNTSAVSVRGKFIILLIWQRLPNVLTESFDGPRSFVLPPIIRGPFVHRSLRLLQVSPFKLTDGLRRVQHCNLLGTMLQTCYAPSSP